MDKSNQENKALFALPEELNDKAKCNSLTEVRKAICKRIKQVTRLQEKIALQEQEIFEYLAQERQILVQKN